jgi:AAA domain-containing protein/DnaB helicase-like protein/regulatory ArsR family protein
MATLADLLTGKIPPQSLEAERAVLGVALLDPHGPSTLTQTLRTEDFFKEGHRKIYAGVAALLEAKSGVDLVTLSEALRQRGELEEIGGPAYLARLVDEAALLTAMPDYCRLLQDKAALRELIRVSVETIGRAYDNGLPAGELALSATRALDALTRGRGRPLAPLTDFATLLATPPPKPVWLVEGLALQGANGWLGAGAKVGKSYLILDLLLACVLGVPWLGTFPVPRPLRVVLIEEEDSAWRVYERGTRLLNARADGLLPGDVFFKAAIRKGIQLDDERSLRPLLDILEHDAVDLVVWDVFNKIHTKDEKRPDQMLPILKRVDRLRDEYGCANLILHHSRKPGVGGPDLASGGQQLRGPSEFWGWAENSLYLKPLKAKGALIVEPESKDALVAPFKVHLEDMGEDARRWVYDGEVAAKVSAGDEARSLILEALALNPMTVEQIIDHTKKGDRTIRRHLAALQQDGALESLKEPGKAGRRLWMLKAKEDEVPW